MERKEVGVDYNYVDLSKEELYTLAEFLKNGLKMYKVMLLVNPYGISPMLKEDFKYLESATEKIKLADDQMKSKRGELN